MNKGIFLFSLFVVIALVISGCSTQTEPTDALNSPKTKNIATSTNLPEGLAISSDLKTVTIDESKGGLEVNHVTGELTYKAQGYDPGEYRLDCGCPAGCGDTNCRYVINAPNAAACSGNCNNLENGYAVCESIICTFRVIPLASAVGHPGV